MAKGYEAHQQRQMALSAFGKDLARRAKSKCELSGESGVPLHIYEIPPAPHDPELSRCLMLSEQVIDQLNQPRTIQPDQWRGLGELIWSDVEAVQIMACRLLTYIAREENWAQDILDDAYLDEELVDEANKQPLD
ncbi:MAG: phnA protein [Verrucomicrobiae bacterium]|nr:phnA protein [Verrucomicrobiae bacterium]NNJ86155.1 phnA protein [Akkermansiaceae bacterium]